MVAAGEDSAQAEDDDEEERRAEWEPQGRPRCVHVRRRNILALHPLKPTTTTMMKRSLFLHSCVEEEEAEKNRGKTELGFGIMGWETEVGFYKNER